MKHDLAASFELRHLKTWKTIDQGSLKHCVEEKGQAYPKDSWKVIFKPEVKLRFANTYENTAKKKPALSSDIQKVAISLEFAFFGLFKHP